MRLGSELGGLNVFALIVSTAAAGMFLVRGQGLSLLNRFARGEIPSNGTLMEGPLLVVAAICLFTPGFVSDAMGACLLLPPFRRLVAQHIASRFGGRMTQGLGSGFKPAANMSERMYEKSVDPEDVVIIVEPKNGPDP